MAPRNDAALAAGALLPVLAVVLLPHTGGGKLVPGAEALRLVHVPGRVPVDEGEVPDLAGRRALRHADADLTRAHRDEQVREDVGHAAGGARLHGTEARLVV